MPLKLMYITNRPSVAKIAEKYGVDRIWVDLETLGKQERQGGLDTVKSTHTMSDISVIRGVVKQSELLVRVNPLHNGSKTEINEVIERGADIVMLPMFRTASDVIEFVHMVNGRAKTLLLVETPEAEKNMDEILNVPGIDEVHIGLNDLHLAYGMDFMFELLVNGQVEELTRKIALKGIPYGFGGIARLDEGMVPARHIIAEHYRLGSSMTILSRSFYDSWLEHEEDEIDRVFKFGVSEIREFEQRLIQKDESYFMENQKVTTKEVAAVCDIIRARKKAKLTKPTETLNFDCTVLDNKSLEFITGRFGNAFYFIDSAQFRNNFFELKKAFTDIYPNFNIAYSYKTNYTPKFCRIINELGGFAEVVSDLEMEIALRIGVKPEKIIWNGPYKNAKKVEELLLIGGTINIDSIYEVEMIRSIAEKYSDHTLNIGIRVNFDVNDGVVSRFGFDTESDDFRNVLAFVNETKNISLIGIHCHFATRRLETWRPRAIGMLTLLDKLGIVPEHIDLGGGLFGKMPDSLKAQFDSAIPTYVEYADAVAPLFAEHYKNTKNKPLLLAEPGSALVGDCMHFASKVINIKNVRGKAIATLLGSIYNINPTLNKKNLPIRVFSMGGEQKEYKDLDFGGFTCIEADYLYRHFDGRLATGDMIVFDNAGSYSIVLKPPFILPNFPVLDLSDKHIEVIKREEYFDDLFHTYTF